jgi:hypothetical protein
MSTSTSALQLLQNTIGALLATPRPPCVVSNAVYKMHKGTAEQLRFQLAPTVHDVFPAYDTAVASISTHLRSRVLLCQESRKGLSEMRFAGWVKMRWIIRVGHALPLQPMQRQRQTIVC